MCLDIIIQKDTHIVVFIISVNVLFLSNSQRYQILMASMFGVYHKCQCPLFKQFTTKRRDVSNMDKVFIISVNVLFLSNSQHQHHHTSTPRQVFIISVNVLFLSNSQHCTVIALPASGVYHKCQCPLFKQFTTAGQQNFHRVTVFIISVNVLFLSNSQPRLRNE